jgi:hypothetical protein
MGQKWAAALSMPSQLLEVPSTASLKLILWTIKMVESQVATFAFHFCIAQSVWSLRRLRKGVLVSRQRLSVWWVRVFQLSCLSTQARSKHSPLTACVQDCWHHACCQAVTPVRD